MTLFTKISHSLFGQPRHNGNITFLTFFQTFIREPFIVSKREKDGGEGRRRNLGHIINP